MADIVTPAVRSRMMSGIRSKNTRHEIQLRKALHNAGLRYRLHRRDLPGTPDIVLPRYRAVIFVHGCFWHGHDCPLFKWPSTNSDKWARKIQTNQNRDAESVQRLLATSWRVCTVWECALRGKQRQTEKEVVCSIVCWVRSSEMLFEVRGTENADDSHL